MSGRVVVWYSCGAASAVAAKLTLKKYPDAIIARCYVANEHPDNDRFAKDCERWFGKEIVTLQSKKYRDCWQVWEERRFLNSAAGALCTVEMKKKVRQAFEQDDDLQIFGYTAEEEDRAERFEDNNPEIKCYFPLIEQRFFKRDCHLAIMSAGIEPPAMYKLGFNHNNCVGCVKGGAGYWNRIREVFPETFERMAKLEESIGSSCVKGKPLRTLQPGEGRPEDFELPDCGLFCGENGGVL